MPIFYNGTSITPIIQSPIRLAEITITENGTYIAANNNLDGYSKVIVAVPNNLVGLTNNTLLEISETDLLGSTQIRDYTFYNCSQLHYINIPDTVTSIGNKAFCNCTSLESITIYAITPPTLINIDAFENTNNCLIYVPENSVNNYKVTWTSLATRIRAIS